MENNAPESETKAEVTSSPASQKPQPSSSPKASAKPQKTKSQKPLALIVFVIVLFALCGLASAYLWQELNKQQLTVEQLRDSNSRLNKQVDSLNQSIDSRLNQLEKANSNQNELLITLDKLALFNTKELSRLHASNRSDWLLAEAEYLLRLGNQRLNIEHDVKDAEAILLAADQVLAEIEDPSIYPIREALAREILSLQAVNKVDLEGMYLQLQALINALEQLNEASFLKLEEPTNQLEPSTAQDLDQTTELEQLWQRIWDDLSKAFVIRRLDQAVAPLLAPEQSYFLKQNLQLMLEQAGLALLNEDQHTFQNNIDKAIHWINQYFPHNNTTAEAMKSTLTSLKETNITRQFPDISESLRLLKTRIEAMYRAHQLDRNTSLRMEQQQQEEHQAKAAEKEKQQQKEQASVSTEPSPDQAPAKESSAL